MREKAKKARGLIQLIIFQKYLKMQTKNENKLIIYDIFQINILFNVIIHI